MLPALIAPHVLTVLFMAGTAMSATAGHAHDPVPQQYFQWKQLAWDGTVLHVDSGVGTFGFTPEPVDPYAWLGLKFLGVRLVLYDREMRFVPHLNAGERIRVQIGLIPGGGGSYRITTIEDASRD